MEGREDVPGETRTAPAAVAIEDHRRQDRLVVGAFNNAATDPADRAAARVIGPGTLDRRTVLLAAIELVDAGDLRQLTMRRLGARLGVEAMALYHYVRGREDLLDGIADLVIEDLKAAAASQPVDNDWRAYLIDLATGIREVARAHPRLFPLVATRRPAAPWIRPPLRSLPLIEALLQTLMNCGFSPPAAARAYRAFSGFLLAYLVYEVAAVTGTLQTRTKESSPADLNDFPSVRRLAVADLAPDRAAAEFAPDLALLLDGLEAMRGVREGDVSPVGESPEQDIPV